tara:strand:- start:1110 stop:1739 length:630 start_codon:yes stop_codon:yes gene_type:complete
MSKTFEPDQIGSRILNWTNAKSFQIERTILNDLEDYRNLDNLSYWKSKMNDEEQEMRRHPNRGYNWIPQRLRTRRDELRFQLLDVLIGSDEYTKSDWSQEDCKMCGVTYEQESQLMKDMTECLKTKGENEFLSNLSPDEYEKARLDCWVLQSINHPNKVLKAVGMKRWTQGSIPGWPSRQYGFCHNCWREHINPKLHGEIAKAVAKAEL